MIVVITTDKTLSFNQGNLKKISDLSPFWTMNKSEVRPTTNAKIILFLIVILFILIVIDDFQGWRFMFFSLGFAWVISYYWARALSRELSLKREVRFGWVQVGDQLEERFQLTNTSEFPVIWVEILDQSNLPGYQVNRVTGMDANGSLTWRSRGICTRRGLYTLGPTTLLTSDPLGLFDVAIKNPGTITLLVTPPVVPLPHIEVSTGGQTGTGRPAIRALEQTINTASVRQYQPGDSLRWIHWPTSARHADYYVRNFDNTPSGNWWIVLDSERDVQVGISPRSTDEHGVILAASLADRGLRAGKAVGLAANGNPFIWLQPQTGETQRWAILRSLASLSNSELTLSDLLIRLRPSFKNNSSLIIISPNVSGEWVQNILPYLWKGNIATVLLLDPQSFGGPQGSQPVLEELNRFSIRTYQITPELLDRPEAKPGDLGQLKWRITPSGRAILVNPPTEDAWRVLS